jgi:hypothetical protein
MTLSTNAAPKPAVEVPTFCDVRNSFLDIKLGESSKQRQGIDSAVQKPRIDLTECIAGKNTRRLL